MFGWFQRADESRACEVILVLPIVEFFALSSGQVCRFGKGVRIALTTVDDREDFRNEKRGFGFVGPKEVEFGIEILELNRFFCFELHCVGLDWLDNFV
jgi:hypothetical protein